jgi:hypothetical protein
MKRTVTLAAAGALTFLAVCAALNAWFQRNLRPEWIQEQLFARAERAGRVETVFLGDSHLAYGLFFETPVRGWLPMAAPGDQFADMLAKTSWLLQEKEGLKTVVIQLDAHNLFTGNPADASVVYLDRIPEAAYRSAFGLTPGAMLHKQAENRIPLLHPENRRAVKITFLRWLDRQITGHPATATAFFDASGNLRWEKGLESWAGAGAQERERQAHEKVTVYHRMPQGVRKASLETFKRLVSEWKAAGVRVVGIRMPLSPEYRRLAAPYVTDEIAGLEQTAGIDEVLDFSTWADHDLSLFCDPNHLSVQGAKAFTPVLIQMLEKK